MRFYLIMTAAVVLGTIGVTFVLFLAGRLLFAVAPHAWGVAVDLHGRARARGAPVHTAYWAAWIILLPVMLLLCLGGGIRRLVKAGRQPEAPYHPHLMPEPRRSGRRNDDG